MLISLHMRSYVQTGLCQHRCMRDFLLALNSLQDVFRGVNLSQGNEAWSEQSGLFWLFVLMHSQFAFYLQSPVSLHD